MPKITYLEKVYEIQVGTTVLEGLEQHGVAVPSSCRSGNCQTCKKKAVSGSVPPASQQGLKPTEQIQGYFLPCICYPGEDMVIADLDHAELFTTQIVSVNLLNEEIAEIKLRCPDNFSYQPGQYIQVFRDRATCRNYSLASLPRFNEPLTLNVKKVIDGKVSPWLHQLQAGVSLSISVSLGNCFYQSTSLDRSLLLMGTGSGLAPLYGIVREALANHHQGDIWLFHGVSKLSQLYYQEELGLLAKQYPQLHYVPCVADEACASYEQGFVTDIAFKKLPVLKDFMIYLSGSPIMVKQASMKAFLAGASMKDIYKDPFGNK